jgi:lysophospholipase L1-like esterase
MKNREASLFILLLMILASSAASPSVPARGGSALQPDNVLEIIHQVERQIPALPSEISALPLVKEDAGGKIWAVWEEWKGGGSRIGFGRYEEGEIHDRSRVGRGDEFNHAAEMAFDRNASPWLVWIGWTEESSRIYVKQVDSGKTWIIASKARETLTGPRILFDGNGRAWVLWNQTQDQKGEIVYRVFDGYVWSEPESIPYKSPYPALNPDAAADERGSIWVVWSSYDGEDYEVFLSEFDGTGWREAVHLTDNPVNDVCPCIALDGSGRPVISWTQVSAGWHQIHALQYTETIPHREMIISPPSRARVVPRIIGEKVHPNILWKSGDGIELRPLRSAWPKEATVQPPPAQSYPPLYNPGLDENAYICFGDSITYGYIDRLPTPLLGYPPRLEIILNKNFGPHRALNRGVGGEYTVQGIIRIGQVLTADRARYILIMEGTNDVITDGLSMDTSAFNLGEMVRICLDAGVFPVIATILPRLDWVGEMPFYRNRILTLNDKIRQIAASSAVPLIDMYTIFDTYPVADGGLTALLSNDLKHPSEKGYQFMAETWFAEIRNFPFAPVNIELRNMIIEGGLPARPSKSPARKRPQGSPAPRRAEGILLVWKDNPKIFDPAKIKGYNIYRKKRDELQGAFVRIAFMKQQKSFFDNGAGLTDQYLYLISALRVDGVEGPCSGPPDR